MNVTYNYIYVPEELPDVPSSTMEVAAKDFYMKWAISMRLGLNYNLSSTPSARIDMDAEIVRRINGKKRRRRFRRSSYIYRAPFIQQRLDELFFTFIVKVGSMLK